MDITVVVQNVGTGALHDGDGVPQDRWPALAQRINAAAERVDAVLLCEVSGWHLYGHRQLARAMRDLDLDALPLAPTRSGLGTAVFYRPQTLGRWARWNTDFAGETLHGFGVAGFEIPGLSAPLCLVPMHLTPFDADAAVSEANLIATRGFKYGPYALLGGDVNYPPADPGNPEPDFVQMRPYNLASRTLLDQQQADGRPVPDRRVARTLRHNGYVDAAWHLYQRTGDAQLLRRTATDDRIDQIWVSAPLASAIHGYRVLDAPPGASDHDGLVLHLETDLIDTREPWTYR
jgi:hypothetical protein